MHIQAENRRGRRCRGIESDDIAVNFFEFSTIWRRIEVFRGIYEVKLANDVAFYFNEIRIVGS